MGTCVWSKRIWVDYHRRRIDAPQCFASYQYAASFWSRRGKRSGVKTGKKRLRQNAAIHRGRRARRRCTYGWTMKGHYGNYGGQFVPETLMHPLEELEAAYTAAQRDPSFQLEFAQLLRHYSGRPTALYFAERLTKAWRGAKIYLKREDLNHTGAHKINNCLGQGLLARRMRKKRIIAETGAGQHGVATATVCALLGLECDVYMGDEDIRRQELNVFRMKLLGAHAARFAGWRPGVLHGTFSYILQDADGQVVPTHSVSAGLDYPAVGPEHARLHDTGRVIYTSVNDREALNAFHELSRLEGIIPALESSQAVAQNKKLMLPSTRVVVINLSGRGDKDVTEVMRLMSEK